MSKRYKGAILSSTPPTTSTSSASGVWTEQQFMQGVASGSWPALAGAPTIGTATAGALNASVAFTAPTYVGSGITGYTATSSPGGITGTGASSPVTVTGLTAGTAYTFTVTATTAGGQGPASSASNSVTPTAPNYIEDVFSTQVYTGTGATNNIVNGIDLSTYGGLVWTKQRNGTNWNCWNDSARGTTQTLFSNNTNSQSNYTTGLTGFNTTGYSLGSLADFNTNAATFASWTFRKQPKFFDVVTGSQSVGGNVTFNHNLGSVPGCILLKSTSTVSGGGEWYVYHRSLGTSQYLNLNTTDPASSAFAAWGGVAPTSTQFTMGYVYPVGTTVVAYLFAHDAGGFGLTGTDNVISCGSYTGNGSSTGPTVTLGYEPQWLLIKRATGGSNDWVLVDNMRGFSLTGNAFLYPDLSNAESAGISATNPTATGFQINTAGSNWNTNGETYIYIAIRRGPMKVPTVGTSVFVPIARTANGAYTQINTTFAPDLVWTQARVNSGYSPSSIDKLRGPKKVLLQNDTSAELTSSAGYDVNNFNNTGVAVESQGQNSVINYGTESGINWFFQRAPSFFDEVCYTGTGSLGNTLTHNLGVTPEMMIVKCRSNNPTNWTVYTATTGNTAALYLNATDSVYTGDINYWNNTSPTSTQFTVGLYGTVNGSSRTYVAYLFATTAGVSKVGTYTGNGTTQTINCGFTGGARFVLIKRTDSTGDWYVYDTARGMTVLTDPYLLLNSTAAETATLGSVTTVSTGFALNSSILAAINASGGTYIFLAIA